MDVRCERCKAQYHFDDAQVGPSGLTVQCTNCKHVFVVKKKELVVTVPVKPGEAHPTPMQATAAGARPPTTSVAAASDPLNEYRIRLATGQVFACRDLMTLQKWIVERRVAREDEVAPPGESYRKLAEMRELDSFFEVVDAADRAAAEPLPPPPPPPAPPPPRRTAARVTAVASPAVSSGPEPFGGDFSMSAPVDDLDDLSRAGLRKGHGARNAVIAVVALAAVAGGAWVLAPEQVARLLGRSKPPEPPAVAVTPPPAPAPAPETKPAEAVVPPQPEPKPAEPAPAPPPAEVKPKGPKALVAQADKLRDKGEVEKALDLYDRASELDPDNVKALAGRGLCYLDLESYEEAAKAFQEALRVDPENADALMGAGEAYRALGRAKDAIRHYERYLLAHPDGDDAPVAKSALEQLRR